MQIGDQGGWFGFADKFMDSARDVLTARYSDGGQDDVMNAVPDDQQTGAEPLSKDEFIAWAERNSGSGGAPDWLVPVGLGAVGLVALMMVAR